MLELYDENDGIKRNDICHLIALNACKKLKKYEKGKLIRLKCKLNDDIVIKNTLMSFNDLEFHVSIMYAL